MPAALHLKSEEIDTPEKRSKFTVSIIGCGLRGIFYAISFAEAGFKVLCFDADQSSIKRLSKGSVPLVGRETEAKLKVFIKKEQMTTTSELKSAVAKGDIIIITASNKGERKSTNNTEASSCCKQIGAALQKESIVVYSEIAALDFVEGIVKETLEDTSGLKVGEDFGLVYCPPQDSKFAGIEEVLIAALDKASLNSGVAIFGTLAKKGIKATMNVKAAELATLFQADKRDVNIALANELAIFCETVGLDYLDIQKLLTEGVETNSIIPTIATEDNRNETNLLCESAENVGLKLRLPPLARQINEEMIKHAVNLTQDALRNGDKTLRRARIAIIGAADPETANLKFIELLEAKGAKISHYCPQDSENALTDIGRTVKKTISEAVEGTDCLVILSEQEQLKRLSLKKLKAIMKSPSAIVDLTGFVEPSRAQEEGFTFRGLGRGAWKK